MPRRRAVAASHPDKIRAETTIGAVRPSHAASRRLLPSCRRPLPWTARACAGLTRRGSAGHRSECRHGGRPTRILSRTRPSDVGCFAVKRGNRCSVGREVREKSVRRWRRWQRGAGAAAPVFLFFFFLNRSIDPFPAACRWATAFSELWCGWPKWGVLLILKKLEKITCRPCNCNT